MRYLLIVLGIVLVAPCAQAQICSVQTTATGWTWSCPQLPSTVGSVCKDVSEDGIDDTSGHSVSPSTLTTKYGSESGAYGPIATRMLNEGVTTAGQYSYRYIQFYPTNGQPTEPTEDMGLYLQQSRFSYQMKNQAYVVNPNAMTCNSSGTFFQGETPDDWDPAAQTNYNAIWAVPNNGSPGSIYFGQSTGIVRDFIPDDGDSLYNFDSIITHPDSAYIIAANSPVQATGNTTYTGGTINYANATSWVKVGMVDYLAGEYGCTSSAVSALAISESGFIVTVNVTNTLTAGQMVIISGATPSGYNNSGYPVMVLPMNLTHNHFQYALSISGLAAGSGASVSVVKSPLVTTGTDPIGIGTCGGTKIASSLAALNTAWGTSYTTWGTSDAGGLTGIANNTYASYGTGTGLLDEKGNHISSSTFQSGCASTPPSYQQSWGNTSAVTSDLRQFVGFDGALHGERQYVGYHATCGATCPPLSDLYYDSPDEVYKQVAPFFKPMVISPSYYTTLGAAESRVQTIINDLGDVPVRVHNYTGIPSTSGCSLSTQTAFCKSTMSAVGTAESTYDAAILRDQNSLGHYAIIGYGHWMGYDWNNSSSTGIYDISDTMYDGSNSSTLSTCGASWAASHVYTAPSCITDSNGNQEMLSISGEAGNSCTSKSGSHPTWATGYGAYTFNDGTCNWSNASTYTQIAQASTGGDYLLPMVQFWTGVSASGSLCDPTQSIVVQLGIF